MLSIQQTTSANGVVSLRQTNGTNGLKPLVVALGAKSLLGVGKQYFAAHAKNTITENTGRQGSSRKKRRFFSLPLWELSTALGVGNTYPLISFTNGTNEELVVARSAKEITPLIAMWDMEKTTFATAVALLLLLVIDAYAQSANSLAGRLGYETEKRIVFMENREEGISKYPPCRPTGGVSATVAERPTWSSFLLIILKERVQNIGGSLAKGSLWDTIFTSGLGIKNTRQASRCCA